MTTELAPAAFESSNYPRTYGVSLQWTLLLIGIGILLGVGGVAGVVFPGLHPPSDPVAVIPATFLLSAISVGLAGLGVYLVLYALRYQVVLTADSVELKETFRSRRLSCAEIQGRRVLRNQRGPRTLVLIPKEGAGKKLKISLVLKTDSAFDAWFARVPDLDREELARSQQEIDNTVYQDLMPEERAARIKRLKVIAQALNWAAVGLGFGVLILPDYHHLLIAAVIALPWVAVWLVARLQPLYRFGGKRNDAYPDLTQALIAPGLLLMVRALTDAHVLGWSGPVMLAVAGGLPLIAAATGVDPWFRQQRWSVIVIGIFTLAYGFGVGFAINVLADSAQPAIYATQVLGKRISRGRSTSYYLTVGPWGPVTRNDEISVSSDRYNTAAYGDTLCIYLGKGALKVPWYQLRDCPPVAAVLSFDGVTLGTTAAELRRMRGPPLRSLAPDHWLYDSIDETRDGLLDVYFTPGSTDGARRVKIVFFSGRPDGVRGDMPNLLGLTRQELVQRFGQPSSQNRTPTNDDQLQFRNGVFAVLRDGKTGGYGIAVVQ